MYDPDAPADPLCDPGNGTMLPLAVVAGAAAEGSAKPPPVLPFTLPPLDSMLDQEPLWSPYMYCEPVE